MFNWLRAGGAGRIPIMFAMAPLQKTVWPINWGRRLHPIERSPAEARAATVRRLTDSTLDVLVIGGGIVGAGVARDAAMRGLSTAIAEQGDFASGTSSRSSRLLHGGMRYLAQGRVGLVREASREKRAIGHIAPHLAQPLAFIFPGRKGTSWPLWKLAIGVKMYDALCGMRNFGRSSVLGRTKTTQVLHGISTQGLTGAVRYFDALTNDARLVIDTIRSAVQHGASALNFMRLENATRSGNVWQCTLIDVETGHAVEVRTQTVVNATGPWSDKLPHSNTSLRPTKGVHLVIDRDRLPIPDAVVMAEGERILFAIPWGERIILGTTDTDYQGPLSELTCDDDDIQYVLEVTNATFPQAVVTKADLVSTWAGLRPLLADRNGNPSDISRRHEVKTHEPGWWDVAGGKLTTYRLMAEETVNALAKFLGRPKQKCETARRPLLPPAQTSGVSAIVPPPVSESLVQHFCRNEWARHLDDLMIRRTSWRHYRHDHIEVVARAARWMANELNWDEPTMQAEVGRYCKHVNISLAASSPRG
jgi:glycerol-3-phosphate dehydrogenase